VPAFDLFPGSFEELLGRFVHEYPMHVQIGDCKRLRNGVQSPFQEDHAPLHGESMSNREPTEAATKEQRNHQQDPVAGEHESKGDCDDQQAETRQKPIYH
jgi:hypothetical protein